MDLHALTTLTTLTEGGTSTGVSNGDVLLAFADAVVARDATLLTRTRAALAQRMGPDAMVAAAGVASNFERMVRIADATGIPLDGGLLGLSVDVRATLNLQRFQDNKVD